MKNNIILIGMPGVGKSTLGVILAKMLGYCFCDTDLVIQETTGKLLRDIIALGGVDGFIETENGVISRLSFARTVVATGGSIVYGKEAMLNMKNSGTVVYLKQEFSVLEARLSDMKGRGVVLREGQGLAELFAEREPLYERYADVTVELGNGTVEENIEKVMMALDSFNSEKRGNENGK